MREGGVKEKALKEAKEKARIAKEKLDAAREKARIAKEAARGFRSHFFALSTTEREPAITSTMFVQ